MKNQSCSKRPKSVASKVVSNKQQFGKATITQQKSQDPKYVLQPIITVNGQRKYKKYQKLKKIGRGTYSQCYLVRTVGSQSLYALKIIPKSKLQVLIRQKLVYEIKIQQQLSHPNVVYLDHWFQDEEFQYIFMQCCSNGNLEQKLRQMTQFPQATIRRYVRQIIQSLIYIHSKNIIHRDLKMNNFYLDEQDNIKLGDFGFACQLNHAKQLKRQSCGTPNYIAPQAISGFGYSFSADVWALGVVLYRMKFAACPFQATSVKLTLQNVKLCKYTFPKAPKMSSQLKDLITKIFNLNYDQRPTLEQIYYHPFFEVVQANSQKQKVKGLNKQKRGFSLTRLFSSSKQKPALKPLNNSPKHSKVPVRSNSCQTFKKMKQTFKQKNLTTLVSSNTLPTQENSYVTASKTQAYLTMCLSVTSRDDGNKTVRDIVDGYGMLVNNNNNQIFSQFYKKIDRSSRLNEFLNKQDQVVSSNSRNSVLKIKQKTKDNNSQMNKFMNIEGDKKRVHDQLLTSFQKKYFFPISYNYQKDINIIKFPQGIRLIVYPKSNNQSPEKSPQIKSTTNINQSQALIFYKSKYALHYLNGQKMQFQSLPKVLKYIIDKKIDNDESVQNQQGGYTTNHNISQTVQQIMNKLPNRILTKKQGLVLIYGTKIKGYLVAKSTTQEFQYMASLQEMKLNTLFKYNFNKKMYQVEDGPVLAKIYAGWTQQLITLNLNNS